MMSNLRDQTELVVNKVSNMAGAGCWVECTIVGVCFTKMPNIGISLKEFVAFLVIIRRSLGHIIGFGTIGG